MGVYLHVPFCRGKCIYCGFYSTVSRTSRQEWLTALERECGERGDSGIVHASFYAGGGTPSSLSHSELARVVGAVGKNFSFADDSEWTIEANPEDISPENVRLWLSLGFNRISIGVQSFDDAVLKNSFRRHDAAGAERAVLIAAEGGFDNIGIDLIIGLPGASLSTPETDFAVAERLPLSHLSLYILSLDEGSILARQAAAGKFRPLQDDDAASLYMCYSEYLCSIGFEHYEISNFARGGKRSVHNTSYWTGVPYVGLGPAAHSYDGGFVRRWNIPDVKRYSGILNAGGGEGYFETETLSVRDLYNEAIMTRLRTSEGFPFAMLEQPDFRALWERVLPAAQRFAEAGYASFGTESFRLTERGWLVSDSIFSELFADEN